MKQHKLLMDQEPLEDEKLQAFIADINAVFEKHQLSIDCTGYDCEGLEVSRRSGTLEVSDSFPWLTLRVMP